MTIKALVHFRGHDPVLCELEKVPEPTDISVRALNPTQRDGKQIELLANGVTSIVYPFSQITFIELFEEEDRRESIVGFFRETNRH